MKTLLINLKQSHLRNLHYDFEIWPSLFIISTLLILTQSHTSAYFRFLYLVSHSDKSLYSSILAKFKK